MGYSAFPKLQHYLNLTTTLFSVISMTLVGGLLLYRNAVGVFYSPSRLGTIRVRTRLLRCRSPTSYPLRHGDSCPFLRLGLVCLLVCFLCLFVFGLGGCLFVCLFLLFFFVFCFVFVFVFCFMVYQPSRAI